MLRVKMRMGDDDDDDDENVEKYAVLWPGGTLYRSSELCFIPPPAYTRPPPPKIKKAQFLMKVSIFLKNKLFLKGGGAKMGGRGRGG